MSKLQKQIFSVMLVMILCGCSSTSTKIELDSMATSSEYSDIPFESTSIMQETVIDEQFRIKDNFTYTNDDNVSIMFDDEALLKKLELASVLKFEYIDRTYPPDFYISENSVVEYIDGGVNNRPYCKTNINYDSFINVFRYCFTDECIETLFKEKTEQYINENGLLIFEDVSGLPTSPHTKELTFDVCYETEDELTLHCNAKIYHPDNPEKIGYYDYYFSVLMTEQGWKFDNFDNAWLYSSESFDYRNEKNN